MKEKTLSDLKKILLSSLVIRAQHSKFNLSDCKIEVVGYKDVQLQRHSWYIAIFNVKDCQTYGGSIDVLKSMLSLSQEEIDKFTKDIESSAELLLAGKYTDVCTTRQEQEALVDTFT
jgi:hypothetical protein